jgi:hypothetical protein
MDWEAIAVRETTMKRWSFHRQWTSKIRSSLTRETTKAVLEWAGQVRVFLINHTKSWNHPSQLISPVSLTTMGSMMSSCSTSWDRHWPCWTHPVTSTYSKWQRRLFRLPVDLSIHLSGLLWTDSSQVVMAAHSLLATRTESHAHHSSRLSSSMAMKKAACRM